MMRRLFSAAPMLAAGLVWLGCGESVEGLPQAGPSIVSTSQRLAAGALSSKRTIFIPYVSTANGESTSIFLGSDGGAGNVQFEFVWANGAAGVSDAVQLANGGVARLDASSYVPAGFVGSFVAWSDFPLVATSNIYKPGPGTEYLGTTNGIRRDFNYPPPASYEPNPLKTAFVGSVVKGVGGETSQLVVQNTSPRDDLFTIRICEPSQSSSSCYSKTVSLPPARSYFLDLAAEPLLATGKTYFATAMAHGTHEEHHAVGLYNLVWRYGGTARQGLRTLGGQHAMEQPEPQVLYLPIIRQADYGYSTEIIVLPKAYRPQDLTSEDKIRIFFNKTSGAADCNLPAEVVYPYTPLGQPGAGITLKQDGGCQWYGSARVVADEPVEVFVNQRHVSGGNAASYEGVIAGASSTRVLMVQNNNYGFFSGLSILNTLSIDQTVSITFLNNKVGTCLPPSKSLVIPANKAGIHVLSPDAGCQFAGEARVSGLSVAVTSNLLKLGGEGTGVDRLSTVTGQ